MATATTMHRPTTPPQAAAASTTPRTSPAEPAQNNARVLAGGESRNARLLGAARYSNAYAAAVITTDAAPIGRSCD